jgi:acyl carrier protein
MHVTNEEIVSKVNKIMREHLGIEEEKITPGANFIDDLGCDSLDIIELTMAFEEEFNVEIADAETDDIQTVQQAYDLLSRKLTA